MFLTISKEKLNNLFSLIKDTRPELFDKTVRDKSGMIIADEGNKEARFLFFAGEKICEYAISAQIKKAGYTAANLYLTYEISRHLANVDNDDLEIYSDEKTITIENGRFKYEMTNNLEVVDCDDYNETELDIDNFLAGINENSYENNTDEETNVEEQEYAILMRDSLIEGNYEIAFDNANKLRFGSLKYRDEIENCIIECANNGVLEAIIFLARKWINKGNRRVTPEAFTYLKKLNDMDYIGSFRWLADCYFNGIGCEQDLKKSEKLYFEAMLFDYSRYSRDMYMHFHPEIYDYTGNDLLKRLIRCYAFDTDGESYYARVKIAELIMDGKIQDYEPATAYALLKHDYEYDGISYYRLGKCVLNGLGTEVNPVLAKAILEDALFDLELIVEDFKDDTSSDLACTVIFEEKDFVKALDETRLLIEQAQREINMLNEDYIYFAYDDEEADLIYTEWKEELACFIKRSRDAK